MAAGTDGFDAVLHLSAILEIEGQEPFKIWFEIPEEFASFTSQSAEPFLLGAIFKAMGVGGNLHVHGHVSHSLLRNLAEFQAAWHNWLPDRYNVVELSADAVQEIQIERPRGLAIAAFSGGVDSCYTIFRHSKLESGAGKRNLEAGLLVHGYDIPLEQDESFARTAATARKASKASM